MKKLLLLAFVIVINAQGICQNINTEVKVSDLSVPASPAFVLIDYSPSLIQNPTSCKTFVLGLAQAFENGSSLFPSTFSSEFSPYWWAKKSGKSIFSYIGLEKDSVKINPFSGLKFSSFSVAFLEKDLIPDSISCNQKIVSIGAHATIVRLFSKQYAIAIRQKVDEWHILAQSELDSSGIQSKIAHEKDPKRKRELMRLLFTPTLTLAKAQEINDILYHKPLLIWDFSCAYALYGVDNRVWMNGRYGFWSSISSYIPLSKSIPSNSYFNLNLFGRYSFDNYNVNEDGVISKANLFDVGGKLALEFQPISIGIESIYRFSDGNPDPLNRTVGVINVRLMDNLFLNGSFGKNYTIQNKLIALLGINFGLGSEKINL